MSERAIRAEAAGSWAWLPPALRPSSEDRAGGGSVRLVETTLLLLAALLLAVATVNDVVRQTHVNDRLIADLRTWRQYTGHDYHNLSPDQELLGITTKRDVVCGNTTPGPPKERVQICLVITGPTRPTRGGMRTVAGGWYLPAHLEYDVRERRYGCFGAITRGLCPR
jgi:hypothetical protein